MTDKTDSKERDLMALVDAYAEARHIGGCHTYNAKTAEARNAVIAKLAASAGSEPVAGMNEYGVRGYLAATLKCWHRLTGDEAAELVAMTQRLSGLYQPTSLQDGMAGWKLVPIEPTEEMLAAAHDGDREYTLRNFGDVMTVMQGPYDHWAAMIDAAPPTTSAGSGKGE